MKKYDWYILFKNHTEAMTLYRGLKEAKIAVRISPTPRQASVCCGVSLLVADEDMASVRRYLEKTGALHEEIVCLPCQIEEKRDRFC